MALRLATNRDVDRKLRAAAGSRFFWLYSLSLWDPDAFWKCISGASGFAIVGFCLSRLISVGFVPTQLTVTVAFEYFLLGLILMWAWHLGPWLYPLNLVVIFTFIFRLYRKNMTTNDLSAHEISQLFPEEDAPSDASGQVSFSRIWLWARRSPILGSLMLGAALAALIVVLLLVAS